MITSFTGKYFFLSNFYPHSFIYQDILYPSSEHAYMAGKTDDIDMKKYIASLKTPSEAKRFASHKSNNFKLTDDWDSKKRIPHMRNVCFVKFSDHALASLLESTGDTILVEGNTWGDKFWGQCPLGKGDNNLGKILMGIREHNRMF